MNEAEKVWRIMQIEEGVVTPSKIFIILFSKIQLVVYYQCCILIGWATTMLFVIAH